MTINSRCSIPETLSTAYTAAALIISRATKLGEEFEQSIFISLHMDSSKRLSVSFEFRETARLSSVSAV
jgi:hypothetical protein